MADIEARVTKWKEYRSEVDTVQHFINQAQIQLHSIDPSLTAEQQLALKEVYGVYTSVCCTHRAGIISACKGLFLWERGRTWWPG